MDLVTGAFSAAIGVILWRLPDTLATSLLTRLSAIGYPTDRVVRYVEDNPALGERAVGTQVDPNSFAGLLVVIAALTGVQLLARKPVLPRWILVVMFLTDIAALVLTGSRSALLGIVAAGILVATGSMSADLKVGATMEHPTVGAILADLKVGAASEEVGAKTAYRAGRTWARLPCRPLRPDRRC